MSGRGRPRAHIVVKPEGERQRYGRLLIQGDVVVDLYVTAIAPDGDRLVESEVLQGVGLARCGEPDADSARNLDLAYHPLLHYGSR